MDAKASVRERERETLLGEVPLSSDAGNDKSLLVLVRAHPLTLSAAIMEKEHG